MGDIRVVVEWGVALRAMPGQPETGDGYLAKPLPGGGVLLAVLDGLGHGAKAADATRVAIHALENGPERASAAELLRLCHEALQSTRGVAMSIARIEAAGTMAWQSVGNNRGILLRADAGMASLPTSLRGVRRSEGLLSRPGVVGYQLPRVQTGLFGVFLSRGDVLVVATDGVYGDFAAGISLPDRLSGVQQFADGILAHYGKDTDDALVLVARYTGGGVRM
jgi:negative regulator of sigma-B (phosphoserine phosphatase)